jgi:ABC-2 type transport system permease protein
MRSALLIAAKDLRQKLRDRSAILVGIVAPFALAALFSSVLGGLEEDFHARWAFVDLDGGEVAAGLEQGALAGMEEAGVLTIERLPTAEAARAAVADGTVEAAIIVPAGFSVATLAGSGTEVELVVDPDATISSQVARSVLDGFANEVNAVQLAVGTAILAAGGFPDPTATTAIVERARSMADPIAIVDMAAADRQASFATYYAAAMAIVFVFFAAQFGLISLHAERRAGTLARLLAAPLRWWAIVVGKVIVSMVMALVSLGVIVIGTALLLGADWGDPVAVATLVLAAAVAATGIALLAVAFTRTEEQAGSAVAVVTMTLAVLGGSFFPANQGPELMSQLSVVTPHAWFLQGVNDAASGGDVVSVAGSVAVLLVMGLVTGTLGFLRVRRLVLT